MVGLPGVLLAVIVRFTLREPPRGAAEGIQVTSEEAPPIKEVFKYLWARRSFRLISLGAGLHAFVGYGVGYWIPAMFGRSHGFTTGEMGVALFYLGFASIAGTFLEVFRRPGFKSRCTLVRLAARISNDDLCTV